MQSSPYLQRFRNQFHNRMHKERRKGLLESDNSHLEVLKIS